MVVLGFGTFGAWTGNIVSAAEEAADESGLPLCEDVLSGAAPVPESGECIDPDGS